MTEALYTDIRVINFTVQEGFRNGDHIIMIDGIADFKVISSLSWAINPFKFRGRPFYSSLVTRYKPTRYFLKSTRYFLKSTRYFLKSTRYFLQSTLYFLQSTRC